MSEMLSTRAGLFTQAAHSRGRPWHSPAGGAMRDLVHVMNPASGNSCSTRLKPPVLRPPSGQPGNLRRPLGDIRLPRLLIFGLFLLLLLLVTTALLLTGHTKCLVFAVLLKGLLLSITACVSPRVLRLRTPLALGETLGVLVQVSTKSLSLANRIALQVSRGQPDALPGTWAEEAYVLLVRWYIDIWRPRPDEQDQAETPLHASDRMYTLLAATTRDATPLRRPILLARFDLAPLVVELQIATSILPWVGQCNGSPIVPVISLHIPEQCLSTASYSHKLILCAHLVPAPPHGVKLNVVRVRRVAQVVGATDSGLVQHERLPIKLRHGVHNLLRTSLKCVELAVLKFRLLVIPRIRQIITVALPEQVKVANLLCCQHIVQLSSLMSAAPDDALAMRAMQRMFAQSADRDIALALAAVPGLLQLPVGRLLGMEARERLGARAWRVARTCRWRGARGGLASLAILASSCYCEAVLPSQFLPLHDALLALAIIVIIVLRHPRLQWLTATFPGLLLEHVCRGKPNAFACTGSEITRLRLRLRHADIGWPGPDKQH
mmetsp:Transcript_41221/g.103519  ORF Transcript_41221/g.103519 Transcript_41221/m.103519 type:complete len:550 (+) Transcript_41221:277-1926(+)